MLNITHHAIERALERLPGVRSEGEAIAALDTPATRLAAQIGARYVRIATGQRIVVEHGIVVTVLPAHAAVQQFSSAHDRRRQHARGWARFGRVG